MDKIKHIIFDLDGTIFNTDLSIFEIWKFLLKREFPEFDLKNYDITKTLGISTEDAMKYFNLPYTEEFDYMFTIEYKNFSHLITIYKDMELILNKLKEMGYLLGIVSSRPYREYNAYLKPLGLDYLFDSKVLKDDTRNHKPNPEPLLKYLEINHINKDECIYIGDMPTDVLCAKNASVKSALMIWNKDKEMDVEADYYFYSAKDLLNHFL